MNSPSVLTRLPALAYIAPAAGQSAVGFDSPEVFRRTAPQTLRLFCARVMAGCAWGTLGCAGFLNTGLSTRAQLATHRLTALAVSSKTKIQELHHD